MKKYYVKIRNITTGELFCTSRYFDTEAEAIEFARKFNRVALYPHHYSRMIYQSDMEQSDQIIGEVDLSTR